MPVILEEKHFEAWLDDNAAPASLTKMLKPAANGLLKMPPVSKRVNSSRADDSDATLINAVVA